MAMLQSAKAACGCHCSGLDTLSDRLLTDLGGACHLHAGRVYALEAFAIEVKRVTRRDPYKPRDPLPCSTGRSSASAALESGLSNVHRVHTVRRAEASRWTSTQPRPRP